MTTIEIDFFNGDDVTIIETNGSYFAAGIDDYGYYTILPVKLHLEEEDTYLPIDDAIPVSIKPHEFDKLREAFDEY
jgi:hypothetical protein